jgi:hypothetical protein
MRSIGAAELKVSNWHLKHFRWKAIVNHLMINMKVPHNINSALCKGLDESSLTNGKHLLDINRRYSTPRLHFLTGAPVKLLTQTPFRKTTQPSENAAQRSSGCRRLDGKGILTSWCPRQNRGVHN